MARVLYAEDIVTLALSVARTLKSAGHVVDVCHEGDSALELVSSREYDVLLLDWKLPGRADGMSICRTVRERGSRVGIILLTGLDDTADKLRAFEGGADDYLTKPFDTTELNARIAALLRRLRPASAAPRPLAGLRLVRERQVLDVHGSEVDLSPVEYRLLDVLDRAQGAVLLPEELFRSAWPKGYRVDLGRLYVYVNRLRSKLGAANEWRLETVRGKGYRLDLRAGAARTAASHTGTFDEN